MENKTTPKWAWPGSRDPVPKFRAGSVQTLLQPARAQCLRLSERFFHLSVSCCAVNYGLFLHCIILCYACVLSLGCSGYRLPVPVQEIDWKDSSLK